MRMQLDPRETRRYPQRWFTAGVLVTTLALAAGPLLALQGCTGTPDAKTPTAKDPAVKDPAVKDPAVKDPVLKDPPPPQPEPVKPEPLPPPPT